MKKIIFSLFITIISFIGCTLEEPMVEDTVKRLNDQRFNGNFVYSYYWTDDDGIEEKNEYYSYKFDGTSKCWYYYNYEYYYDNDIGWLKGDHGDYHTIETNEVKTHFRLSDYGNGEWKKYQFLDDGNTLRIWDYPNELPDLYKDYKKKN